MVEMNKLSCRQVSTKRQKQVWTENWIKIKVIKMLHNKTHLMEVNHISKFFIVRMETGQGQAQTVN